VAFPASVLVSKDGYASGSTINSVNTTATLFLWNQDRRVAGNTLRGKVFIETDLTNTAAEVAPRKLVNVFTNVRINGKDQRFDWTTLTDANGNYSIALPDLESSLFVAHASFDSTSTMYINGIVPGAEGAPSKTAIPATFYLGTSNTSQSGSFSPEQANNVIYGVPNQVGRFYAIGTTPDLNSKVAVLTNLRLNLGAFDFSTNTKSAAIVPNFWSTFFYGIGNPANYEETSFPPTQSAPIRYAAGTTSTPARVVDLLGDYFTTLPVLQFNVSNQAISSATVVSAGVSAKNDGFSGNNNLLIVSNRGYTSSSTSHSTFIANNRSAFFTSVGNSSLNGGKTFQLDLSYGPGKLRTGVR
jgi:hypothetical protein